MNIQKALLLAAAGIFLSACSLTSAVISEADRSEQEESINEEDSDSMGDTDGVSDEETDPSGETSVSESGAAPETDIACFNSFYPVREGSSWSYQSSTAGITGSYTHTFRDVSDDAFTGTGS